MNCIAKKNAEIQIATSCGTIIVNESRKILLCHVTGMNHWDIPKGVRESYESPLEAAVRELREETGLELGDHLFEELGDFDYQRTKRLHLYRARVPSGLVRLDRLRCNSCFSHPETGESLPEMDDFCWASRADIRTLCTLPMAERLLSLDW